MRVQPRHHKFYAAFQQLGKVFWDVSLCGFVDRYQHFRGICCLLFWASSSETKRDQSIVLFTKTDGKIPLGRPRHKWKNTIKIYLKEIRLECYWLLWVQKWNSGFHNVGNLLPHWATISPYKVLTWRWYSRASSYFCSLRYVWPRLLKRGSHLLGRTGSLMACRRDSASEKWRSAAS